MTKKRSGDPWMPAPDYSASLRGLTINLVVDDIDSALIFHTRVLGATVVYAYPELRVHGRDPDDAQAAAQALGFEVLAVAADKGHGLRETYLLDGDGYLWVPDVLLSADRSDT